MSGSLKGETFLRGEEGEGAQSVNKAACKRAAPAERVGQMAVAAVGAPVKVRG